MALFRSNPDSSNTPMAKPASYNPAEQHNIIGKDTVIEGTLRSSGNVHISGTVHGNVEVDGRTVVMPDGRIEGEVISATAEIGGRIQGHLVIKERLVLKNTAVVEGDIRTAKLVIEDGATFTGRCDMGSAAMPSRPARPEASRPEASRPEASRPEASKPEASKPEAGADKRTVRHLGSNPDLPREAAQA